jgi:hypothetical protein
LHKTMNNMKKIIYLLFTITLITITGSAAFSQTNKKTAATKSVATKGTTHVIETGYMWPVKGKKAGEWIVCKPQGYIEKEFNFDNLFITAPEGSTLVSPHRRNNIQHINRLS